MSCWPFVGEMHKLLNKVLFCTSVVVSRLGAMRLGFLVPLKERWGDEIV